ncbi:glycoside hydrolase family 3 [Mesorhizobium sp. LSJC268A00]|uniref:glycoside hydrolase family 3 protein n=1 Tax=unclassified Mesorhizobium TaxID=325217 RepID=UPI0003CE0A74|nr:MULTISPECIES: glycoside hydrolase family 3 protein [unclassified Mesorhizobium]ESX04526.1 glycoside hydrolase family 3 [Mesorhizobium sp. LSJC268A00]ESZ62760.1 glycoside hydrolase family 3 [Mesorhizobium sp. L103C131B0]ESZ72313.1 glycoside hydrolase family 3 [Mesorhizobium sp. L103C119B0]
MPPRIAFLTAVACAFFGLSSPLKADPPVPRARIPNVDLHRIIEDARLRQMIGQMVLVGFVGSEPGAEGYARVVRQAEEGKITGVIYLGRNIDGLKQVRQLNEGLQRFAASPLLIAVDQEGGRIQRFTGAMGFNETPSEATVAKSMSPDEASVIYQDLASALSDLGFNLNLAPVVDVNVNPANPIIGKLGRSFSADPQTVEAYAKAFVEAHRAKGVLTVLKHFPGHGSSTKDSHKGMADVSKTWSDKELLPYKNLIASGDVDMVMSAHVINNKLSFSAQIPSSLSRATLTGLLRDKMHFKGVVISDDMQMQAITDTITFEDSVRRAVLAGNDILIFANDKHPDPLVPEKVAALLSEEARKDPEMLERIQKSYENIMRLKRKLAPAVSEDTTILQER